jgi:hypothetical protein
MTDRPRGRSLGLATAAIVVALVAAGCGSDDTATTTTSAATTQAPATTAVPTTAAPTTTTIAPTSTTAPPTTTAPVTTVTTTTTTAAPTTTSAPDTNALADGSGCTPGTADSLPDGEWFGYVSDADASTLDFDLACWFTGDAAAQAAAEDGEESPPPNDYYVRNVNPALRTLDVAPSAQVTWLPNPGDPSTETTVTYADWLVGRTGRAYQPGVWLTVGGGAITEFFEQYVP